MDSEAGPLPEAVVGSCEAAIICGKAYSTPILSQIADEILSDEGIAISIQNGMGHAQQISSRLGRSRTLVGRLLTEHGGALMGYTGLEGGQVYPISSLHAP